MIMSRFVGRKKILLETVIRYRRGIFRITVLQNRYLRWMKIELIWRQRSICGKDLHLILK